MGAGATTLIFAISNYRNSTEKYRDFVYTQLSKFDKLIEKKLSSDPECLTKLTDNIELNNIIVAVVANQKARKFKESKTKVADSLFEVLNSFDYFLADNDKEMKVDTNSLKEICDEAIWSMFKKELLEFCTVFNKTMDSALKNITENASESDNR